MMRVSVAQQADTASFTSSSRGPGRLSTAAAAWALRCTGMRHGWKAVTSSLGVAMMPPPSLV